MVSGGVHLRASLFSKVSLSSCKLFLEGESISFFYIPAGQTERDREEKRWMNGIMWVVPRGLNLMD